MAGRAEETTAAVAPTLTDHHAEEGERLRMGQQPSLMACSEMDERASRSTVLRFRGGVSINNRPSGHRGSSNHRQAKAAPGRHPLLCADSRWRPFNEQQIQRDMQTLLGLGFSTKCNPGSIPKKDLAAASL